MVDGDRGRQSCATAEHRAGLPDHGPRDGPVHRDVPGRRLLRTGRRPTPHLFTPDEILTLMHAAHALGPRDTFRPHTVATVIGLLASCGLRASEAMGLDVTDVALDDASRRLRIRQTKFHKSRLVPLHPTTAEALRTYAHRRHTLGYDGLCDAFFVSERGTRLTYHTLARTFVTLARVGLEFVVRRRLGAGRGPGNE